MNLLFFLEFLHENFTGRLSPICLFFFSLFFCYVVSLHYVSTTVRFETTEFRLERVVCSNTQNLVYCFVNELFVVLVFVDILEYCVFEWQRATIQLPDTHAQAHAHVTHTDSVNEESYEKIYHKQTEYIYKYIWDRAGFLSGIFVFIRFILVLVKKCLEI